jgi:hypothetical protein
LTVQANGGEVNFFRGREYGYGGDRHTVDHLTVVAKDRGFVDLGIIEVQNLKVDIFHSKLESHSIEINRLEATIRNKSKIEFSYSTIAEMQVSTDSTSFCSLNKYR